jgi:putative heme transporter
MRLRRETRRSESSRLRGQSPAEDTSAPVEVVNPDASRRDVEEEMPRVVITRERALLFGLFVISVVAFLYFVLPKLTGLKQSWQRVEHGEPVWLVAAAFLEVFSFIGYVWLFRAVFVRGRTRIGWKASYEITMAGLAATRLFAAAGAGGIALTAWALRRSGMEPRVVACRLIAFMALLYAVYMGALVICGIGLYIGAFSGPAPFAITIGPAIVGLVAILVFLAVSLLPADVERRLDSWAQGSGRLHRTMARLATIPASAGSGIRTAIGLLRANEPGLLGALVWWGFDIAVLWATFHAFGSDTPPIAVIVMAYFVGMLGNTLPLPGGIGGVDGGMIGAFAAFDVNFGYATVAVLAYRVFSFWLPTVPGAVAYLQLRRTVNRWGEERAAERMATRSEAAPA